MTKKVIKILTLICLISTAAIQLSANEKPKVLSETKIEQLDKVLTNHKAVHRNFKTKKEYTRYQKHHAMKYSRGMYPGYNDHRTENYRFGYYGERYYGIPRVYPLQYGHAHRHPKRGWILAYRYDRAAFYDRHGFYYGYFNRYGYFFEGIFYHYDRFYTYRDRVRGKELFGRNYYRPAAYRYYGFCR